MKTRFSFILLIVMIAFISCDQLTEPQDVMKKDNPQTVNQEENVIVVDIDQIEKMFNDHLARIVSKEKPKDRIQSTTIVVPDDYSTIQEAVDNALTGDNILVKEGTYTGTVLVTTDGLDIKATGDVLLEGHFSVKANDVKIRNFKIVPSDFNIVGIYFYETINCEAKNNTVYYSYVGIGVYNSQGANVVNNTCFYNRFGIGTMYCSYSTVKNNSCYSNGSHGLSIQNSIFIDVKENSSYENGYNGILLYVSSYNDFIGNTLNNNGLYGLQITPFSENNSIKDNTAKYNYYCDIFNNSFNNTFLNNDADCTQGF